MYTLFSGIPAPVLARCHAGLFTEDLREIRLRRKADAGGYLSYRQIGGYQKPLAGFQPPVCQVIDRRLSDTFGKGVCQIEFVDMCDLRQGIQCNVLGIVGIDITLRQSTFLGQLEGGVRDDGQILLPGNIYQKHLEQSVAHLFKAGKLVAEFLHHQLGEVDELFFVRAVAIEAVSLRIVLPCTGKRKCKSVHTEYDIFHGIVGKCFFRVLYIGIDDDQIIRLHRHLFVLYIEGALAPQDLEQF